MTAAIDVLSAQLYSITGQMQYKMKFLRMQEKVWSALIGHEK